MMDVNNIIWRGKMNKVVRGGLLGMGLLYVGSMPAVAATDISKLPVVTQELVAPPFVPKHDQAAKGGPKVVKIRMETHRKADTDCPQWN